MTDTTTLDPTRESLKLPAFEQTAMLAVTKALELWRDEALNGEDGVMRIRPCSCVHGQRLLHLLDMMQEHARDVSVLATLASRPIGSQQQQHDAHLTAHWLACFHRQSCLNALLGADTAGGCSGSHHSDHGAVVRDCSLLPPPDRGPASAARGRPVRRGPPAAGLRYAAAATCAGVTWAVRCWLEQLYMSNVVTYLNQPGWWPPAGSWTAG